MGAEVGAGGGVGGCKRRWGRVDVNGNAALSPVLKNYAGFLGWWWGFARLKDPAK